MLLISLACLSLSLIVVQSGFVSFVFFAHNIPVLNQIQFGSDKEKQSVCYLSVECNEWLVIFRRLKNEWL